MIPQAFFTDCALPYTVTLPPQAQTRGAAKTLSLLAMCCHAL